MWLCLLSTIPPTFLPQKLCRKCSLQICTGFSPYVMLALNSRMEVILAAPLTECTGLSWWEYSWEEKPSEGSEGAQFSGSSCGGLHPEFQKPLQRGWLSCEGQSPVANYGHWVAYDSRGSEMGLVQYLFWFLSGNESTSLHFAFALPRTECLHTDDVLEVLSFHSSFLRFPKTGPCILSWSLQGRTRAKPLLDRDWESCPSYSLTVPLYQGTGSSTFELV